MSLRYVARASLAALGLAGTAGGVVAFTNWEDVKFKSYSFLGRAFQFLDPETAHTLGVWVSANGCLPVEKNQHYPGLQTSLWGKKLSNPIGLAAGFDKNGEAMEGMLKMGFGFVEVGSVTPLPQDGNPKPRMFRLPEHRALINRCGFNGVGIDVVQERMKKFRDSSTGVVGINLGVNKANAQDANDAASDYCLGIAKLGKYADYLVINVSSPNTQGLRNLQANKTLKNLIKTVRASLDRVDWEPGSRPPLFVKLSPDLSDKEKKEIAKLAVQFLFDGLIVSNTTVSRPELIKDNEQASEVGGLSGCPIAALSTQCISDMYKRTNGCMPIIGCGGVANGKDAYDKIRAGASLVQLYTSLAYGGPNVLRQIKLELVDCLQKDGFSCIEEAIGADHRKGHNAP